MIQPIKQNVAFKANKNSSLYSTVTGDRPPIKTEEKPTKTETTKEEKPKKGIRETFRNAKLSIMNFVKGFNNIKDTTSGAIRGAAEGVVGATVIGTIGANFIKSQNAISADQAVKNFPLGKLVFKTITGTISDVAKSAWAVIKSVPDLITKAPKDNFKNVAALPGKFIKYMGSKKLIALSAGIILLMTAIRAIQGKIKANKTNANIDHSMNEGHVATNK